MHPLGILAFATFVAVVAFAVWNRISVRRHQQTGGHVSGIGGPADPMAGSSQDIRNGDEIRESLDAPTLRRTKVN